MTKGEAITIIEAARKTMYLPKSKEYISDFGYALEMAIEALEAWDKIFSEYEALTDQIVAEHDIKNATERIDKWCVDMLRSAISDYYARRVIDNAKQKISEGI